MSELSETEKQTVSALATLAAGLAGGLIGGSSTDAIAGAQIGRTVVENNTLANHHEKATITKLANEGLAKKEELDAASCALLKCSAGFAEGSAERAYYEKLEKIGSQPEYAALREKLSNEQLMVSYADPTTGITINYSIPLFQYDNARAILDGATYANGTYQLTERGMGLIQAAGGAVEIIAGGVSCVGGVTCAAGMLIASSGLDNLYAGSNTAATGSYTKTVGAALLETLGVPAEYSEVVYSGVNLTGTTVLVFKSAKTGEMLITTVSSEGKLSHQATTPGVYLENFKPSPTPAGLVQQQAGKGTQVTINTEHILNGEIKTYANGTKVGIGGHYLKDPNIKVDTWTGAADANGVTKGYISVRDPATGQWIQKKAETTFFPEHWSKRQTEIEIKSAFENSKQHSTNKEMWTGTSSNGMKMEGYYKKPDGTGATAWPIYSGK